MRWAFLYERECIAQSGRMHTNAGLVGGGEIIAQEFRSILYRDAEGEKARRICCFHNGDWEMLLLGIFVMLFYGVGEGGSAAAAHHYICHLLVSACKIVE